MQAEEQMRFDNLYRRHLRALKLQGLSDKTIDVYARAVRRIAHHYDCCPDQLTIEQLEIYFAELVESHSWSTVKVDRNGLQFFWQHVRPGLVQLQDKIAAARDLSLFVSPIERGGG